MRRFAPLLCGFVSLLGPPAQAQMDRHLCRPAPEILQRLQDDDFTILSANSAGGGVMGARKLELRFADGTICKAKWKVTSSEGDSWNNSPRREIGSYAAQRLFLEEADYLVPPVAARCIPLEAYRPVLPDAAPTIRGTRCVFGALAAWLDDVVEPEHAYDPSRFASDPTYAHDFADLNLLHYLIDHRDARANNFLAPKDSADPRVFSIDNGIAFGGVLYNFFTWHFNEIRVPALSKASIERLRRVRREDLDALGVLGQLEIDAAGVLRNVAPTDDLDPDRGTRLYAGLIQFGLTREEIDAIAHRIEALLARIDAGEIGVF